MYTVVCDGTGGSGTTPALVTATVGAGGASAGFQDMAGNYNAESDSTAFTLRADPASTGAPTVTITARTAPSPSPDITSGAEQSVDITFEAHASEPTAGSADAFAGADLVITPSTGCAATATETVAGQTYERVCTAVASGASALDWVATVAASASTPRPKN